jgi:hypothetical protein
MKLLLTVALLTVFALSSCKKERTCECSNTYSTYDAGTVEKSKSQAKKYCESLSAGDTKCKLK